MSIYVSSLAWQANLPFAEQHVLLALADHAWDDGSHVYPSVDYTAWKTNLTDRAVQLNLRRLEARGILIPVAHLQGGRKHPTVYRIAMDAIPLKEKYGPIEEEEKGEADSPIRTRKGESDDKKGESRAQKGESDDKKGERDSPETSLTIKNRTVKETYARARDEISFDNQKQKTAEAERPRSMPTTGNTARLPEVTPLPDPTPPVAPPPLAPSEPAPKPAPNYGAEKFLYWQQVLAQMDNQYGAAFMRNYLEPCKLFERRPGSFVLVAPTPFAQEQINVRARDRVVMYLAVVARTHVELEVVNR